MCLEFLALSAVLSDCSPRVAYIPARPPVYGYARPSIFSYFNPFRSFYSYPATSYYSATCYPTRIRPITPWMGPSHHFRPCNSHYGSGRGFRVSRW